MHPAQDKQNAFKFYFRGMLLAGVLPNLHIADLAAVNFEAYGGAYSVGTILACSSRVDVEQIVYWVVNDFEDMRVPGNKDLGTAGLNLRHGTGIVSTRITSDMGHQYVALLDTEKGEVVECAAGDASVDIAVDCL